MQIYLTPTTWRKLIRTIEILNEQINENKLPTKIFNEQINENNKYYNEKYLIFNNLWF